MKVLFVHQNFPGQFVHLAPALASRGHEVVALGVESSRTTLPGVRHVRHRPVPSPGQVGTPHTTASEWLTKLTRAESAASAMQSLKNVGYLPDLVFGHPGWGEMLYARDVFPTARPLTFAEYYYGAPGGDSFFDPEFQGSTPDLAALQRLRLKNTHLLHALTTCDEAVSPTVFQKSQHPLAFQDRIRVIHDGIDTERFAPDARAVVSLAKAGLVLRPGDEVVTFFARQLEPYRGYHIFMRSLVCLQQLRPQARVVIVGGEGTAYGAQPPKGMSWKNIFLDEVKDSLDMSRVHFVGQVPHELLMRLLQVSAAHVYLTYPFVLSWSMLEAMSMGCLLVGSDTAPVREVIEHGHNGVLVDFFKPLSLAETLADVLRNPRAFERFRREARQTVIDRYDLKRICLPAMIEFSEINPSL